MRIIAGTWKRRNLVAPKGMATRPTSDRLRETLFNVLDAAGRVDGAKFADLYAGSGAVALEALSRGAREAWAAENAVPAVKALRENVAAMGAALMGQALKIETRGVRELLEKERGFDVVFLDPPYEAAKEYTATLETLGRVKGIVAEGGLVVAEHSKKNDLQERYGRLLRTRVLTQGDAALSFYEVEDDDS